MLKSLWHKLKEIEAIHQIDEKQDETDKKHDLLIAENISKNEEQDNEILRQQNVDKQHSEDIKKTKILAWIGIGIAFVALAISIIGIF